MTAAAGRHDSTFDVICARCQMYRFGASQEEADVWMTAHDAAHREIDELKALANPLPRVMPAKILKPRKKKERVHAG